MGFPPMKGFAQEERKKNPPIIISRMIVKCLSLLNARCVIVYFSRKIFLEILEALL